MTVALNDEELKLLRMKLKQGDYDGVDIMHAWLAIDELRKLRIDFAATEERAEEEGKDDDTRSYGS